MATYEVNGPDGRSYNVEGPAGASDSEVFNVLQQHLASQYTPPIPSAGKTLLHGAERGIAPAAAGLAGFGAGAAAAAPLDPFTFGAASLIAGIGAGAVAAYGASKAQKKLLEAAPEVAKSIGQDPTTQQAEEQAHPIAAQVGEALPQFAAFRPSLEVFKAGAAGMAARKMAVANSALGAGMDLGQQELGNGSVDWRQVGTSAALGALANKETVLGKKLVGVGKNIIPGTKSQEGVTLNESIPEAQPESTAPAVDPRDLVLNHITGPEKSNKKSIMDATNLSAQEVVKQVNILRKEGLIDFEGKGKGGEWKLTPPSEPAPEQLGLPIEPSKPVLTSFDVNDLAAGPQEPVQSPLEAPAHSNAVEQSSPLSAPPESAIQPAAEPVASFIPETENIEHGPAEPISSREPAASELAASPAQSGTPAGGVEPAVAREVPGIFTPEGSVSRGLDVTPSDVGGRDGGTESKSAAVKPEQSDDDLQAYWMRRQLEDKLEPIKKRQRDIGLKFDDPATYPEDTWFKRGGMKKEDVQKLVDEHTANWTNKPDITVYQSPKDAPYKIPDTVKGGAAGNEVHLFADNLNSPSQVKSTLFHESLGHYGLRQNFDQARTNTMRDIYNTNTAVRDLAQKWLDQYSDKSYIKDMSRNQQVAYATEEILAKSSEKGPIQDVGIKAAWNRVAAMIRNFGRRFGKVDYSDNDVRQILSQAHERVISGKKAGTSPTEINLSNPATKKVPGVSTRSPEELINQVGKDATGKNYRDQYSKESLVKGITHAFTTRAGFQRAIGLLQNYMRPIRNLQEDLRSTKRLEYSGPKMNALYDLMSTSGAKAVNKARELEPHIKELNTAIAAYAKKSGLDTEKTLKTVHAYAMALHEPERRHQKFIENVPLDNKTRIQVGKASLTPADYRAEIMKKLYSSQDLVSTGIAKQLRAQLENLVQKYKDPAGYSPIKSGKASSLNEDSPQYGVLGDYTKQELQSLRDRMQADPNQKEIQDIFTANKKIQNKSAEFDRESNYRTQPVDNLIDFYGWKHYVPFKGNPKVSAHDDRFELQGKRVGGEFNQYAEKTEGRDTDSTNPILQTVADAGKSAARVGRLGVTDAIKNLIEDKHIPGKLKQTVPFEDRYNGTTKEDIQGENKVFHYKPDGSIEVYSLKSPDMVHAIKGFTGDVGKFWKGLNMVNTTIGGLHTRYNPAFAPYNFVRHAMTSAMIAGAEKGGYFGGPMTSAKFLGTVASKIIDGGLWRAGRMAAAIEAKDNTKIADLAGKHSFYQDLKDYIDIGGPVSYTKNFSIKSQEQELLSKVGPSKFLRTLDHVKRWFDLYNNTFELAGRAAGFGVVRDNIITRMKGEGADVTSPEAAQAINLQAAAYTKNLFNYEQVGKYGREAGSLYMFLRPSLTTAVRSLDAIAPAFSDAQSRLASMPESIKSDPTAVKNFLADHESKRQSSRMLMAGMVGSGIALYHMALLGAEKDDQGRNKVADDDMAMWTRNMRLPIGFAHGAIGQQNDYLQLPWGFGLGSFGAFGAQMAGIVEGHNTLSNALGNMIPIAMDSYMPLPVPKFNPVDHPIAYVVDAIVPSFARPFIEYGMNVDEFGRQIYNDRASAFGDAYTGGEHLPEIYSAATKALADSTNGSINISPNTLHFFTNSYFDGLSRIAHDTYGMGLTAAGQKDFDIKRDIPVLDSFIGKSSSYDAREFSDVSKEVAKKQAILTMYKNNPDQLATYIDRHPNAQMQVNIFNTQVNGMLKQVSHQIGLIQSNPDMSGKEKTELLKELREQQDWIKRNVIDTVKDYD